MMIIYFSVHIVSYFFSGYVLDFFIITFQQFDFEVVLVRTNSDFFISDIFFQF